MVLQVHGGQLPARHTYMMERLEDKVAAINSRMLDFKAWLKQRLGAQYSVPVPVHLPVQVGNVKGHVGNICRRTADVEHILITPSSW